MMQDLRRFVPITPAIGDRLPRLVLAGGEA